MHSATAQPGHCAVFSLYISCRKYICKILLAHGAEVFFSGCLFWRRRSRRLATATAAAPSPDTQRPVRLLDLPTDLLVRVVSRFDPADIARVADVSLLFRASLAEEGIQSRIL